MTNSKSPGSINWKPFIWIAFVVISLWLGWLFYAISIYGFPDSPGQLGDLFGGINTLFSGLAFAGLIFTIYIQIKEFQLQRKELELTRNELAATRRIQEGSLDFNRNKLKLENLPRIRVENGKLHLSDYQDRKNATFQIISYPLHSMENGFEIEGEFKMPRHELLIQNSNKELLINLVTNEKFVKPNEEFTLEVRTNMPIDFKTYQERFASIFVQELSFNIKDVLGNKYVVTVRNLNNISETPNHLLCQKPLIDIQEVN